jgi:tRNA pseudouridine38-40 synthase
MEKVDNSFHSRYHAKSKRYLYRIWNRKYSDPFLSRYSVHVKSCLDIDAIKKASSYFIGPHDFTSFTSLKSKKKSMEREIYSIDVTQEED